MNLELWRETNSIMLKNSKRIKNVTSSTRKGCYTYSDVVDSVETRNNLVEQEATIKRSTNQDV